MSEDIFSTVGFVFIFSALICGVIFFPIHLATSTSDHRIKNGNSIIIENVVYKCKVEK